MGQSLASSNVGYGAFAPYAPPPPVLMTDDGSNVVEVDFKAGRPAQPRRRIEKVEDHSWKAVVTQRLSRLHSYVDGWDGPGSKRVSDAALIKASRILDLCFEGVTHPAPPATVPCSDGSLQLEWWLRDVRFDLVIEPDGGLEAWGKDRASGSEVEETDIGALELFLKWAVRLTADKLVPLA